MINTVYSDKGGPAFPLELPHGAEEGITYFGMTLRDYFAAKAMQAIIAKFPPMVVTGEEAKLASEETAIGAFRFADAMLKARGEFL